MYRQPNERFSQNTNVSSINPYLSAGHLQPQKMHMQSYNHSIPPPMFNDPSQNVNNCQYPPPSNYLLPSLGQSYDDRSFGGVWRQMPQPIGSMMPGNLGPSHPNLHNVGNINLPPIHYDTRAMTTTNNNFQPLKGQNQGYMSVGDQVGPQMHILQRLSGIIKSQLVGLHSIMRYADQKNEQERQKRQNQRSRSRQKREQSARHPERQKQHREWNCSKCSFLNFDFRDLCKRCKQPKPASSRADHNGEGSSCGKKYLSGPNDWKCLKCKNINYARRIQCYRCYTHRAR